MIERLEWDSNFFGYNIGRLDCYRSVFQFSDIENLDPFDLVYLYAHKKIKNEDKLPEFFTRVIFSTNLDEIYPNPSTQYENIFDLNLKTISQREKQQIINLSYQSGTYSRFKLDEKFSEKQFQKLYQKWVDNSINQKIADQIVVSRDNRNNINGFVTISHDENSSTIGLIAVSHNFRGQGIGSKLISSSKYWAKKYNSKNLTVATQLKNSKACDFYLKKGFEKSKSIDIYHLWQI